MKIRYIAILFLATSQVCGADVVIKEQIEEQHPLVVDVEQNETTEQIRKKEEKKKAQGITVSDILRIGAGASCLIGACIFYREARRGWIGLNEESFIERFVTQAKKLPWIADLAPEDQTAQAQKIAKVSGKVDIAENLALALFFSYFGSKLLAKGLRIH